MRLADAPLATVPVIEHMAAMPHSLLLVHGAVRGSVVNPLAHGVHALTLPVDDQLPAAHGVHTPDAM